MIKKTIRVSLKGFSETEFIKSILDREFDVIIDDINPKYIIIYSFYILNNNRIKGDEISSYLYEKYNNAITIFYGCEAYLPNFNFFDYIIGYDDIVFGDRYIRRTPLFSSIDYLNDKTLTFKEAKELLYQKKYFCNFIYGNSEAHQNRDLIFNELSKYKFVHSLGKHLNNSNIKLVERYSNDWFVGSIEAKRDFKFSIASENNLYRDGVTEKIVSSMEALTIPIYFGDSNIGSRFNTKSFINSHDYENIDYLVKKVKEVNESDELWCQMMIEPWQTKEQKEKVEKEIENWNNGFLNIFRQDLKNAKRKPSGYWVDLARSREENIFENYCIGKKFANIVNKIVWFIPVKKWRNNIRYKVFK